MSKKVEFQLTPDIYIDVNATVVAGFKGHLPWLASAGEPPCPPEVEDLYVAVNINGILIDITDRLPEKLRSKIEDECLDNV